MPSHTVYVRSDQSLELKSRVEREEFDNISKAVQHAVDETFMGEGE